jgi:hypothetical protein
VAPDLAKGAGDQAMLGNRHVEALACYEAAYRYAPNPSLLYNQARALEFLHQNAEALRRMLQFQRGATADTKARVPQLPELIASLRGRVGQLEVVCNVDGAHVSLDDAAVGATPLPEALLLDPATVRVKVWRDSYVPYEGELPISAGERRILRVQLDPVASDPARVAPAPVRAASEPAPSQPGNDAGIGADADPASPDGTLRVAAWTSLGVGAAAGVFAGVSYGVASSHLSDICGGATECSADDYDAGALDDYDSWRGIYAGSLVVAGVGLAAGGILLWVSSEESESESGAAGAALGVAVVPGGLSVSGQF